MSLRETSGRAHLTVQRNLDRNNIVKLPRSQWRAFFGLLWSGLMTLTWVALAVAPIGDRNKTFDYLDKALSGQEIEMVLCIRYPILDPMRSDRRYAGMMRRLGLPE
jgi:hypothetical protein